MNIKDDGSGGSLINELKGKIVNWVGTEVPNSINNSIENSEITKSMKISAEFENNKK